MKRISGDIVEMYQRLANNLPNTSVVMFDRDMRYTLAEGAFITQLIPSKTIIIGKMPHELLPPSSVEFLIPMYQRILNGESFSFERNTAEFSYQSYASPIKDDAGEVVGGMILTHDMSETKRTEAALRASESRFHSLVDLAPVGIIQTDVNGKRVFCNSHWCEITGLTLEQALNSNSEAAIFPNDIDIAGSAWDTMMRTRLPFSNVIFRYLHADGSAVWVSGNGRPMFNENGEVNGYLGTVTDISDIKHLADALNISERRYRTLVDFAPVGIVETDTKGAVILANNYWSTLSGVPIDHNFTENASDTIHPDDFKTVRAINQNMLETSNPIDNLEYRFVHPDGKIVWVSDSSRPVIDTEGEVTSYIIAMTDITERKRLETTLRQNEERLRVITDNIQDIVTQHDARGQVVFASESCRTALGYDPQSVLGQYTLDFVHPDEKAKMEKAMKDGIKSGAPFITVEFRLRHHDEYYIHMESIIKFLFDDHGKYNGAVFICRDITERLRMQEMLLEQKKLHTALEKEQELGTLKTLMMQRIAHEFRTPLTIIQSSSETLTKFLDRLTSDQKTARVDSIERQIRSITDMLDQIGLAIYGSFKPSEIYREATDVSRLCREVAAELEAHMHQTGKFTLDLPESAVINVDQQVLKRAISNVLRNAARFSPSTAVVQVRLTLNEQMMDLFVKDTGIGILPQEQPRIFEPFFRGSNINEVGGLGVGLTIARAAVEAHDGTITVESAPKQGTTVTLRIPVS